MGVWERVRAGVYPENLLGDRCKKIMGTKILRSLPKYATEWEKVLGVGSPESGGNSGTKAFWFCMLVNKHRRREKFENLTLNILPITIMLFSRDPNDKGAFRCAF